MTRILRLVVVLGLATGLFFAKDLFSVIDLAKPAGNTYEVSARDLQLNCNGPAVIAGGKSGISVTNFRRIGKTSTVSSYSGASGTSLTGNSSNPLIGFGGRQDLSNLISGTQLLTVKDETGKTEQGSKLLTAMQIQLATDKKIRGLLAAPCLRPQSEFWFVGGSTKVGREALLLLNNPSQVDATVDLEIFTENGTSHSAGLSGIAVPKGKTTILPLASFVLGADSITVHVLSQGGSITALIQQKAIRGLSASGADYVLPSETISNESYFPGIFVRGQIASATLRKNSSKYYDVKNMLRVYVPGEQDAKLTLQILGSNTETFGTVIQVSAPAGKVSDFDINGLQDGDYFGILNSDVPVRSAIRLIRTKLGSDAYTDFAWVNAAEAFNSTRYVAIPKSGISKLALVNPTSKTVSVSVSQGAESKVVRIKGLSEAVVPVNTGLAVGLTPSDAAIHANLVIDVKGRVSIIPVLDEKNISGEVSVSVH